MSGFRTPKKSVGDFKIAKDAVVCSEAQLVGDITIGSQTVVHPSARILAEAGPIVIGDGNLIQEQVTIVNSKAKELSEGGGGEPPALVIGSGNVFEVGCYCESRSVGDGNTLEAKSTVGPNTVLTDRCVIGASCHINAMETLPPDTIIYGAEGKRYTKKTPPLTSNQQQLEYLIKVLPNYHHLIKTSSPT